MKHLVNSFKYCWRFLGESRDEVQKVILVGLLFGLVGQFLTYTALVADNAHPRSIVRYFDNDASRALQTLEETRLYNDNGFNPYGPFYFRLTRLLERGTVWPQIQGLSKFESYERERHFFLQVTNFVMLLLLCYFFAWLITGHVLFQVIITQALAIAFLQDETWVHLALRPHPDHTLALVSAVAGFFALRTLHTTGDAKIANWHKAAIGWGIAGATKFTTVLFLPALIVPNFSFVKSEWWKRFLQFFLVALGAYIVVGFPQSFDLAPFGYHLFKQSNNVTTSNLAFMKVWTRLFWEQMQLPFAVIFWSALLVPERKTWGLKFSENKKVWLMSLLYVLLPTMALYSREVRPPYRWYPMPFICLLFVGLIFCLPTLYQFTGMRSRLEKWLSHGAFSIALFIAWPMLIPPQPQALQKIAIVNDSCFEGVKEVKRRVEAEVQSGGWIVADPHVPFSLEYNIPRGEGRETRPIQANYDNYPDRIEQGKTTLIVVKPDYYKRYLTKEEGGYGRNEWSCTDIEATRRYYRMFFNKEETTDQYGQVWKKTFSKCGIDFYRRADLVEPELELTIPPGEE
jgi:hypothetical protein